MHCIAGKAHASGSKVEGFSRVETAVVDRNKAGGTAPVRAPSAGGAPGGTPKRSPLRESQCRYEESREIFAGDMVLVKPKIRDRLGNNTAAPEGALNVTLDSPDGQQIELQPSKSIKSGLTNYEVQYEPHVKGWYLVHVRLKGAPIAGSPVKFECIPSLPDVGKSSYTLPTDTPGLLANKPYIITVVSRDRCGNRVEHGGASVQGRLQSANLPPQQEALLEVEDKQDGTYDLKICLKAASDLKVIISIDKDRQGEGGGEFPPIPMSFNSLDQINKILAREAKKQAVTEQAVTEVQQPGADSAGQSPDRAGQSPDRAGQSPEPSSPEGSSRSSAQGAQKEHPLGSKGAFNDRLREAGNTIIQGFGMATERRDKVSAMAVVADMAVEANKDVSAISSVGARRSCGSCGSASFATSSIGQSSVGTCGTASIGSQGQESSRSSSKRTPRDAVEAGPPPGWSPARRPSMVGAGKVPPPPRASLTGSASAKNLKKR